MPRSLCSNKRIHRRKKILKLAKGFRGRRGTNYKAAKDAVVKALTHSFEARRDRKGDMRRLWINMAIEDPDAFKSVVEQSKKALGV